MGEGGCEEEDAEEDESNSAIATKEPHGMWQRGQARVRREKGGGGTKKGNQITVGYVKIIELVSSYSLCTHYVVVDRIFSFEFCVLAARVCDSLVRGVVIDRVLGLWRWSIRLASPLPLLIHRCPF